jgi:hypothetical protein
MEVQPINAGIFPSYLQFSLDFCSMSGIFPGALAMGAHLGGAVPYPSAGRPLRCGVAVYSFSLSTITTTTITTMIKL